MGDLLSALFDTDEFPRRWDCGPWTATHGGVHIASDVLIFAAYTAIPVVLAYFVLRRKDVPFLPVFWLFAAFILSCGVGHLIEASLYWYPWYRLSGLVKICTAVTSWATVLALTRIIPQALALPGLSKVNAALEREISDRHKAEDRFRLIVEAAPNGIVVINREGRIALVNAQAERLFGYRRDELLGQPVETLLPERFRRNHPDYHKAFFAAPETRALGMGRDLHGQRKDGSEFPVEIGLSPIETAEGPMVLGAIVDTTERKRAVEALRASEELFRSAFEDTNVAMVITGIDNRIVRVNAAFVRLFGYAPAELLGMSMRDVTHPDHLAESDAPRQALLAGETSFFQLEKRYLHKDGRVFWGLANVSLIRDALGQPLQYLGQVQDITERRHEESRFRASVEEAQRQSEESFQLLVDSAQDYAIFMLDPEGRVATWNDGAKRLKGYEAAEILGRHFSCFYTEAEIATNKPEQDLVAARQLGQVEDEGWRLRRDGSRYWANVATTALWDRTGQLRGYAQVTRDFTRRKESENRITQLNTELAAGVSELRDANHELESFCYSVSHDLRAPLRAIDGFSRIVLHDFETLLPAEAAVYLRDVRANTQQMGRLIDDLLDFSRLSRQPLRKQPCRPADLVQECLRELQPQHTGRRVEIRLSELPECQADPALLKQVWINLLSNAFKFTGQREAALVEIGWQATDQPGEIAYFVKDNGVGFDMQYSDKLFGVFQRLHRAEDYPGTGVGLAIVQRIVHRHGGRIWAESQPDQGTTFYFTLS